MNIHSSLIAFSKRKRPINPLLKLNLLFIVLGFVMMTSGVANATPTLYVFFNNFTFPDDFQVTTTLQFRADPAKDLALLDFSTLDSFRWFVGSNSMPINAGNSCGSLCAFDLTDPTSPSNLGFILQSDSSYSVTFNNVTKPVTSTLLIGNSGRQQQLVLADIGVGIASKGLHWGTVPTSGQPIPEPATVWLMLTGLVGLGGYGLVRGRSRPSSIH